MTGFNSFYIILLVNGGIDSESNRKKLVDKKLGELNLRLKETIHPSVPAVQGTEIFSSNPEMMRQELLTQDPGTECTKYVLFNIFQIYWSYII